MLFRRNPRTVVREEELMLIRPGNAPHLQLQMRLIASILESVVNQVHEQLLQGHLVCHHHRQVALRHLHLRARL